MITVRAAAERAFGKIPEGATIHIKTTEVRIHIVGCTVDGYYIDIGSIQRLDYVGSILDEDISGRHASAFTGFFGAEFDKAVKKLEDEE